MGRVVLQYNHCTCDTVRVLGAGARKQARRRTRARGACRRQAVGAGGTSVRELGGRGRARQATGARGVRGLGAERASWSWAVHSVHSAYFRSVLTRYCS